MCVYVCVYVCVGVRACVHVFRCLIQFRFLKEGQDHTVQNRPGSDLDGLVRV